MRAIVGISVSVTVECLLPESLLGRRGFRAQNLQLLSGEFDHIAVDDLFAFAQFDLAVDLYLSIRDDRFGLAAGIDESFELEDFAEFDRLFFYGNVSHRGIPVEVD